MYAQLCCLAAARCARPVTVTQCVCQPHTHAKLAHLTHTRAAIVRIGLRTDDIWRLVSPPRRRLTRGSSLYLSHHPIYGRLADECARIYGLYSNWSWRAVRSCGRPTDTYIYHKMCAHSTLRQRSVMVGPESQINPVHGIQQLQWLRYFVWFVAICRCCRASIGGMAYRACWFKLIQFMLSYRQTKFEFHSQFTRIKRVCRPQFEACIVRHLIPTIHCNVVICIPLYSAHFNTLSIDYILFLLDDCQKILDYHLTITTEFALEV